MLFIAFILAGYNHLEVAEYLLDTGADVNAQDKGGLIPLHNASSYGVSSPQSIYDCVHTFLKMSFRSVQTEAFSVYSLFVSLASPSHRFLSSFVFHQMLSLLALNFLNILCSC